MLANGVLVRSDDASEGHSRSEQALHRLEPRLDYHRGERAPRAVGGARTGLSRCATGHRRGPAAQVEPAAGSDAAHVIDVAKLRTGCPYRALRTGAEVSIVKTPPAPPLKSRFRPLPTHTGMKYFRKVNPLC